MKVVTAFASNFFMIPRFHFVLLEISARLSSDSLSPSMSALSTCAAKQLGTLLTICIQSSPVVYRKIRFAVCNGPPHDHRAATSVGIA